MLAPLAVELFAGTGSATAGWCALGGRAVCFDLEYLPHHGKPHAGQRRVIQDVLTLRGKQFRDAAFIWGSPPCQNYSYLAMPWSRSKPVKCEACGGKGKFPVIAASLGLNEIPCVKCGGAGEINHSKKAKELRRKWESEGPDNRLFDACFRIQREACEAAGQYIPLIVENVRGAIPWVGPSKANYGSFHLWGDVEMVGNRIFVGDEWKRGGAGLKVPQRLPKGFGGGWFENSVTGAMNPSRNPREFLEAHGQKVPGFRFDGSGRSFQTASVEAHGVKVPSGEGRRTDVGKGARFTSRDCGAEAQLERIADLAKVAPEAAIQMVGTKIGGDWFSDPNSTCRKHGSRSNARKAASAMIAKIPLPLSNYIAQTLLPERNRT